MERAEGWETTENLCWTEPRHWASCPQHHWVSLCVGTVTWLARSSSPSNWSMVVMMLVISCRLIQPLSSTSYILRAHGSNQKSKLLHLQLKNCPNKYPCVNWNYTSGYKCQVNPEGMQWTAETRNKKLKNQFSWTVWKTLQINRQMSWKLGL